MELAQRRGSFYHDPRWVGAIATCFRLEVHCITAADGDRTVGTLALTEIPALFGPRRLVSLPFSYAAGPLVEDGAVIGALYHEARAIAEERGIKRVEIKCREPSVEGVSGFERSTHYSTYLVSTEDGEEGIWNRLHPNSTRRGIRKAERSGVTAEAATSVESWRDMARLQQKTSARLGLPAPPVRFFTDTCRQLQGERLADLLLARAADGRVIAGTVIWKGPREWIYAFGASERRSLSSRPNHAILWLALREAAREGVAFDLGRAAPEQRGLVQFKLRWGGEPRQLGYDYWPRAAGLNTAARDRGALALGGRVWAALPWRVTALGSWLYRYLG